MTVLVTPSPHPPAVEDQGDQHRLTALEGLAALSLDALSSVAYGPEAIVIVLAAAGTVGLGYTVPVTIAIVVLLAVLVTSYRQVIEALPERWRRLRGGQAGTWGRKPARWPGPRSPSTMS